MKKTISNMEKKEFLNNLADMSAEINKTGIERITKDDKWVCPTCGTTKITPWYVKELEPELEGMYPEIAKKIIEKVGKMLNKSKLKDNK